MSTERREWIIFFLICSIIIGLGIYFGFFAKYKNGPVVENTPEKPVADISRMVMSREKPRGFNGDTADEGLSYTAKLYFGYILYEVTVLDYKNGQRTLSIDSYETNVDFDSLKNPADAIAHELRYGRPTTAIEEHMFTDRTDGQLVIYQIYMKKKGSFFMGFTREERDLGQKAGVTETLFAHGDFLENGKWTKATPGEIAELQAHYLEYLKDVHKLLKIKD